MRLEWTWAHIGGIVSQNLSVLQQAMEEEVHTIRICYLFLTLKNSIFMECNQNPFSVPQGRQNRGSITQCFCCLSTLLDRGYTIVKVLRLTCLQQIPSIGKKKRLQNTQPGGRLGCTVLGGYAEIESFRQTGVNIFDKVLSGDALERVLGKRWLVMELNQNSVIESNALILLVKTPGIAGSDR